jgi:hypothetical protein
MTRLQQLWLDVNASPWFLPALMDAEFADASLATSYDRTQMDAKLARAPAHFSDQLATH